MTNQEFFTKTVLHVLSQTKPSKIGRKCVYAGDEGGSCAIGCHMPRELAEAADALLCIEGDSSIESVEEHLPEATELFTGVTFRLMSECQEIHDNYTRNAADLIKMRGEFQNLANKYKLEMPC